MVQPPVTAEAAVDATAASAIAVYVEELQPDVPDSSAAARPLSLLYGFKSEFTENLAPGTARTA